MKLIIVGAGISGLTAGYYAQKAGFEVEIYERNISVGGLCTGWYRKGSYIDGCIHWLTESKFGNLNKLWKEIGALDDTTKIVNFDYYNQAIKGDETFSYYLDTQKLEAEMMRFAEGDGDKKLIKRFIKGVKICKRNAITTHKPYFQWNFLDKLHFIFFKALPIASTLKRDSQLSLGEFAQMFKSPMLQFALKNTLIPCEYSLYSLVSTLGGIAAQNAGVPLGGSLSFANRIKTKFEQLGGKVFLRSDVENIDVENGKVVGITLKDGSKRTADFVISACDLHYTLKQLLKGKYNIPQIDDCNKNSEKYPVFSSFLLSFRTNKDLTNVPHNRYKACIPFDVLGETQNVISIKHFGYDPTMIKNGYTTFQMIFQTNNETFDKLQAMSREEYVAFKKDLGEKIIAKIKETDGDLYGDFELLDIATPLTYKRYVNTHKGSFMSYMYTKNTKQMIIRNDILPIKNFSLAGQWMMLPGGLPIAAMQGKFAAMHLISERDKKK